MDKVKATLTSRKFWVALTSSLAILGTSWAEKGGHLTPDDVVKAAAPMWLWMTSEAYVDGQRVGQCPDVPAQATEKK